jgi:hypothetical protein
MSYSCVLIKALSWWTFLTISWILLSFFWLWQAISKNRYGRKWEGVRKDEQRIGTANQIRYGGRAETKVFANRERNKNI